MRSVIYSMSVSLDGYIAGPDGSFDWTTPDEGLSLLDRSFASGPIRRQLAAPFNVNGRWWCLWSARSVSTSPTTASSSPNPARPLPTTS
jgi:hypothetical protein